MCDLTAHQNIQVSCSIINTVSEQTFLVPSQTPLIHMYMEHPITVTEASKNNLQPLEPYSMNVQTGIYLQ